MTYVTHQSLNQDEINNLNRPIIPSAITSVIANLPTTAATAVTAKKSMIRGIQGIILIDLQK